MAEVDEQAHFVYDLDSLFGGRLRSCIRDDNTIGSLLSAAGCGDDFGKYMGQLDRLLTDVVNELRFKSDEGELQQLIGFIQTQSPQDESNWDKD